MAARTSRVPWAAVLLLTAFFVGLLVVGGLSYHRHRIAAHDGTAHPQTVSVLTHR